MPFAATFMELERVILSEVSQTKQEKYHDTHCMWDLKRNDTNELSQKTETDTAFEKELKVTRWKDGVRNSQGVWDGHVHIAIFKMNNQQGFAIQHMELCSMLCCSLDVL